MTIKKSVYTKEEKMIIKSENYKEILEFLNQFERVFNVKISYDESKNEYTCVINLKEECYNG